MPHFSRLTPIYLSLLFLAAAGPATRPTSAFYPQGVLERVRAGVPGEMRDRVVAMAEPWKRMSDEELWSLMYSANLPRSWMVWSDGFCPACKKPIPMYNWKIDAINHPWKVQCPECQKFFPTNDFKAYYDSGLDADGLFDPKKADRSLLFNVEHPDPKDPLHGFGVDDGMGYVEGKNRWRFIPTYLVFGQWKQAALGGVKTLATAYVLTGNTQYAHNAGVILHRIATLYPSFTFKSQGVVYEIPQGDGYVSIWHDACVETRELAIAYDAVKEAVAGDESLAAFLATKPGGKGDVIGHIEEGILKDPLRHPERIYSNYPQQNLTQVVIQTALGWPGNRAQVLAMLKPVLDQSTAVDGLTGEKGLANYSAYAAQQLALFLGYYTRVDPEFLPDLVKQTPRLAEMYRFFIATHCLDRYYPLSGDTGWFAAPQPAYAGVLFSKDHFLGTATHSNAVLPPSMYSFLYDLYKLTGDSAFAQVLYGANGATVEGLPYDVFCADPAALRRDVQGVIEKHGASPTLASVNFPNWHLAILRAGKGESARALWLDYDAGGNHGHADGMNMGLFALGLDLAPDFGYPPVQFGGWATPRAQWYTSTAAHNTVLVDSANQPPAAGACTFFAAGDGFSAVSANGPGLLPTGGTTYARTLALIDTSPDHSYALDIFRVAGGKDHIKSFSSHFSTLSTTLENSQPATDIAHSQLRNFKVTRDAAPGWSADFKIEDRYHLMPEGPKRDLHLKYMDLTGHADAYTAEAWVVAGTYDSTAEAWIPRVITRRRGAAPLSSTFVDVLDPYDGTPAVRSAERLPLVGDGSAPAADNAVAISVTLADGRHDVIVSAAPNTSVTQPSLKISTDATLAQLRLNADGRPVSLTLCQATAFSSPALSVGLAKRADLVQLSFPPGGGVKLITGDAADLTSVVIDGKATVPSR